MNLRVVVISAACLAICIVPASSTSLLAAAAAVKGAIVGAGLTALKSGRSETVIIQPNSVAQVVPASQITVQDLSAKTIAYTSSNPISRLFGAVTNAISAKAKAVGDFFQPNPVVIVVPENTTTPSPPVVTVELRRQPYPNIDIELGNKPRVMPVIDIELGNKPLVLPGIDIALESRPLVLPRVSVEQNTMFRRPMPVLIDYLKK